MSWKALDWATESDIRSPTTKSVLHLLANKADEDFSCYPSIRTLMAESGAGRSTVMRALQELEATGFITRRSQFHDSGAQGSTPSPTSNHPQAPHPAPRSDLWASPGIVEASLCCGRLVCSKSLVLDRRHQCSGAVSASVVVEVLAPGHHNLACVGFGGEVVPGQDLVFEGREERLRSGVIETSTDPSHRL